MGKANKAFLKEENLLTLLSQNNFIIPEIQREYVWGNNEKVILKFLKELKSKIGEKCDCCNLPTGNSRINIGFLYSYKPDYVKVQNDRFLDENLIDGQQRFTTLFLLTFYCAIKENKKNDFLSLIRFDEVSMSFDFKVRDLTKRFLLELVDKINSIEDLNLITYQTWFLRDYNNDVSIASMIKSLGYIQNEYNCKTRYYNHLLSNVVFWHFKTEVTSEGEELYITMNARGEDLADNEITKAALMLEGKDLFTSGKKWEEWQNFFWQNRDKKRKVQSADFGFNSFISCIAGLENYLKYHEAEFKVDEIEDLLTTDIIERYITAFNFLISKVDAFKSQYRYAKWVDDCIEDIWSILNKNETDWFIDYTDRNKGTEQNRMIFIWSWLLYMKDNKVPDVNEFFRVLRFFYVRYKNYNRAVVSLESTVNQMRTYKVFDTSNQELKSSNSDEEIHDKISYRTGNEIQKYKYLASQVNNTDLALIESLIWEIEDHPLNIEGADLGNINSLHLVSFESSLSLEDLQLIKDSFYMLFPLTDDGKVNFMNANKMSTVLLFYGEYWQKRWASYYWRYNFGDWKRIIRDSDSIGEVFKDFFEEFKNSNSLEKLINEKLIPFDRNETTEDEIEVFRWYAIHLKEKMWSQGQYISNDHYKYTDYDENFLNFKTFVNNKGTFNGGNPKVLSDLINEMIKTN